AKWNEPHYEKMLYDQALLALAFLETYQATGKAEYAQTARDTFTYVLRDLQSPSGAFYAAQDAHEAYYKSANRAKLPKPGRDEKILADWNGLMIAALAYGAVILNEPKYADAATHAADAVFTKKRKYLDDYAFLTWGFLNLYESTFDIRWLEQAISLNDEALRLFGDNSGRFYVTSADSERLLVRPRESGDGAIPSGNSVMILNLIRLARMTANDSYEKRANAALKVISDEVTLAPSASTHALSALSFVLGPSQEIVLSGTDVRTLQRAVFQSFVPNKVVLQRPDGEASPITKLATFTAEQRAIGDKPTAYICTNYACKLPMTDPAKVVEALH
ncbi:MAG: thioredoxin domain-containing protein, partial [Thermoanaerobaculia bacterium]